MGKISKGVSEIIDGVPCFLAFMVPIKKIIK